MSDSRPFVEGTRIQAERLAAAALGFIGAQWAAGFADLVDSIFAFLSTPLVASRNAWAALASGLTKGPIGAIEVAYGALLEFVSGAGILGFVFAIASVIVLAWIAVQGRDLLG